MVYLWNLFITLDNSPSSVILTVFFFSQYCYWMCFRHSLLYCCRCIMYACIPFFSFGFRWILYGKKICEIKRKRKWNKKEKKMVNDFYTYLLYRIRKTNENCIVRENGFVHNDDIWCMKIGWKDFYGMFFLCTTYPNRNNKLMIKQCDGKFTLCWIEWKNKISNWTVT